jgi:hypothetical protein
MSLATRLAHEFSLRPGSGMASVRQRTSGQMARFARRKRRHDPVEYYLGWGGYWHPIGLQSHITKDEADVPQARGRLPSLRAQRSDPSSSRKKSGLLRCARNDEVETTRRANHSKPVQPFRKKFFASRFEQITFLLPPSRSS